MSLIRASSCSLKNWGIDFFSPEFIEKLQELQKILHKNKYHYGEAFKFDIFYDKLYLDTDETLFFICDVAKVNYEKHGLKRAKTWVRHLVKQAMEGVGK